LLSRPELTGRAIVYAVGSGLIGAFVLAAIVLSARMAGLGQTLSLLTLHCMRTTYPLPTKRWALNGRLLMEGYSPGFTHSDIYGGTKRFGRARLVVPASRRHIGDQRSSVGRNPPAINIIEAHLHPSAALGILVSNSRYS